MKVLETVDTWQARVESSVSALEAADTFTKKAYSLIAAPRAKKAFDIHAEPEPLRDEYGRNSLGQGCLMARRLVEAGVTRGLTLTSWPTLQTDIRNAGGNWVDEEVVVDDGIVTSRKPDDITAFNEKMVELFAASRGAEVR